MSDKIKCNKCKGIGTIEILINMHDNKKEIIKCNNCNGSGVIHQMTKEEEIDYWMDY
jgi:DnaJ-class molecular chaperone